jgi:hypothetical protein
MSSGGDFQGGRRKRLSRAGPRDGSDPSRGRTATKGLMGSDAAEMQKPALLTSLAGLGLFAVGVLGDFSDIATTFTASFAALIAVLGYDLHRLARRESSELSLDPAAALEVIRVSIYALLAAALLDWSIRATVDPPTVVGVFALAGTALAGGRRARRNLTSGRDLQPR